MAAGEEELVTLRDLVASRVDKIVLVGYVRPPKSFVESAFQEKIKHSYPWLDFNRKRLYPKYLKQIVKFDKVYGWNNVLLWKFDPATFTNGCVVQDFCSRLSIDFPVELIKPAIDGMSREVLAFLYTYHKYGSSISVGDLAKRGECNELLRSRLATLRGNKLRFSWAAVTPGLEAYSAKSSLMAKRMGEPLDELSWTRGRPSHQRATC